MRGASWGVAGSSEWCWSSQQVGRPALTLVVTVTGEMICGRHRASSDLCTGHCCCWGN